MMEPLRLADLGPGGFWFAGLVVWCGVVVAGEGCLVVVFGGGVEWGCGFGDWSLGRKGCVG